MFFRLFSRRQRQQDNLYRNFVFGVEDSLVSTVGLLSGVTVAGASRQNILVTGLILIFVEAFSMGIGSFLSEDNSGGSNHSRRSHLTIAKSSAVMFVSYLLAGTIPLFPYLVLPPGSALLLSIFLALVTLFLLGLLSGKRTHQPLIKSGAEMFLLGGLATMVGVAIGGIFTH